MKRLQRCLVFYDTQTVLMPRHLQLLSDKERRCFLHSKQNSSSGKGTSSGKANGSGKMSLSVSGHGFPSKGSSLIPFLKYRASLQDGHRYQQLLVAQQRGKLGQSTRATLTSAGRNANARSTSTVVTFIVATRFSEITKVITFYYHVS